MSELTPRQQEILMHTIESYIATGLPVGSQTLTERYRINLSSASVRHEMGILEEMGFLTHPHTSAGRVPTDGGYRFYVSGVREEQVPDALLNSIAREMERKTENLESLMEQSSHLLSAMSEEAALVVSPTLEEHRPRPRLFVQGFRYILNQPEFQDLRKFQLLMETLEEKSDLADLLKSHAVREGVHVAIGEKELSKNIWDCSLVTAPYGSEGKCVGVLAVLGPRRMPYGKIIGLVHQMAGKLTEILAGMGS